MCCRRLSLICIMLAALAGPLVAQTRSAAGEASPSRSPVPHPDILSLPAGETARGAASADKPAVAAEPGPAVPERRPGPAAGEAREIARAEPRSLPAGSGDPESQAIARHSGGSKSWFLVQMWPLLAVLAVIAGAALAVRKLVPGNRLVTGSQILRIVARTHVTPRQQLMLVKLGRQMVLLGVSSDRVTPLATVTDPEQVAMLLGEAASGRPNSIASAFSESFEAETHAYAAETDGRDPAAVAHGQVHGLLEKVRSLAGKTG
jgi:flagellar biogenesis protein FliO